MVQDTTQENLSVKKYKRFFYTLPIIHQRTEEQLIQIAKDGLKEEIRNGLETEVFPTLEALFDEAEEVEEALKEEETPPPSPRKRRRRSDAQRASKRARKAANHDPEDEGYGYDREEFAAEEGQGPALEDDLDEDEDVGAEASNQSDDTIGSGQFRMDDYLDGSDSTTSGSRSSASD
ncbi:Uncharacterized protein Rs2_15577 [Raphanus sativus]|nr:Uncharacterized protein Rs2_15577 [Raphanus sativus]